MTRSLSETDGLDAPDKQFLRDIQRVGWNVTDVFKLPGERGPDWSFSCGLFFTFLHPEVIIFGLTSDVMAGIINEIGMQVQSGARFEPERSYDSVLEKCPCTFRVVAKERYPDFLGSAIWFYERDPFPVLQCFWPDKKNLYPWDPGCNPEVRDSQPLLFKPS